MARAEEARKLLLLATTISFFGRTTLASGTGYGSGSGCIFSQLGRLGGSLRHSPSRAFSRSLLQSNCGLQFDNQVLSFSSCQNITSQLGTDYNLLWTVVSNGNGNSTFRGAIDAAASSQIEWAGFGFAVPGTMQMLGGSALIVKECQTCSSGASIDDYYLANYLSSAVQPPSHLKVLTTSAAMSNGRLQGVFEVSIAYSGTGLDSVSVLFAAGPLDPTTGDLQQHIYDFPDSLNVAAGLASSLGPALAPAPALLTAPSPATGPSALTGTAGVVSTVASSAGQPAAATVAPAPSPSALGGSCSLLFAGNSSLLRYTNCQSLTTASTANGGFNLYWNLTASPAGNGSVMTGALESGSAGSWAGWGIAAQPGSMIGANAIIVKPCSSCSTGASADNYYLAGHDPSQVVAGSGRLNLTQLSAAKTSAGAIQATFAMFLAQNASSTSQLIVIASVGPVDSGDNLQAHPASNAYSGTVNLAAGTVAIATGSGPGEKPVCHGILMIVGWGLLLPLGVVFARCKEWGPIWFQLHRFTQTLGYLAGVAGAAVAVAMGRVQKTNLENSHRAIGLAVFILLTLQVASALFWRPAPLATKIRYTWNAWHWILGGTAILLAFANVFVGLKVALLPATWSGLYALAFGLIALAWSGKSLYNIAARPQQSRRLPTKPEAGSAGTLGSEDSQEVQSRKLTDGKREVV